MSSLYKNKSIHESVSFEEATLAKRPEGWFEANYDYWNTIRRMRLRKMPLDLQQDSVLSWFEQCVKDRPWDWVKSQKKKVEILKLIMEPIQEVSIESMDSLTKSPLPWFKKGIECFIKMERGSPQKNLVIEDSFAGRLADLAIERGEYDLAATFIHQSSHLDEWIWGYFQRGEGDKIKPLYEDPLKQSFFTIASVLEDWDGLEELIERWGFAPTTSASYFSQTLIDFNAPSFVQTYWMDWCLKNREQKAAEMIKPILKTLDAYDIESLIGIWNDRDDDEYPPWASDFFNEAWASSGIKKSFYKEILQTEIFSNNEKMLWAMKHCSHAVELTSYEDLSKYLKRSHKYEDEAGEFKNLKRKIKVLYEKEKLSHLPSASKEKLKSPRL